MTTQGLTIKYLVFTGTHIEPVRLNFQCGLNLVYGASNTGKSFTLKSIDFMLGGSKPLPDIDERTGYEMIWFGFSLVGVGDFTLSRSTKGGNFILYEGLVTSVQPEQKAQTLSSKHDPKKLDNLSQFLLNNLGFAKKFVATHAVGKQDSLSFRDLTKILLVNETGIQIEQSPIESGQRHDRTKEHSVFRLLLTGVDDSSIVPIMDKKAFDTSKAVRIEIINEMIADIDSKLMSSYPDIDDLPAQNQRIANALEQIKSEFDVAQGSIQSYLDEKRRLSIDIPRIGERLEEIQVHIERFAKLNKIYISDIERLGALEEVSFLLSLGTNRACPLCGAPAEAQQHMHEIGSIEQVREASLAEIAKIEHQRTDLAGTIFDLRREDERLRLILPELLNRLAEIESEIDRLAPKANESQLKLSEIIMVRDHVKKGLALLEQKNTYIAKREEFNKLKKAPKTDNPKLDLPGTIAHEFCKIVSHVLKEWQFPGECHVSFDEKTYDLRIDGKLRVDNGKGVRAVTHAAFKVALLLFCRGRGLPHPGFVVLDTPLLTYRDPIKNPKLGELSDDEKALAQTPVKQRFFEHLSSIRNLGQFIILENIDPPANIGELAHVHLFYGNTGGGRNGLFPVSRVFASAVG
jgi:hypothetical protein